MDGNQSQPILQLREFSRHLGSITDGSFLQSGTTMATPPFLQFWRSNLRTRILPQHACPQHVDHATRETTILHNFANISARLTQKFYTHARHKLQFVCSTSLSVTNIVSSAVQAIIDGDDAMLCCMAAGLSPLKMCTRTRAGWALLAWQV